MPIVSSSIDMGNGSPEIQKPPSPAATSNIQAAQTVPKDSGKSGGKDWAVMFLGLAMGFASFAINDTWLFSICLFAAWACFVYLAIVHSNFRYKILFCVFGTLVFVGGAYRAYYYSESQVQANQREAERRYNRIVGRIDKQEMDSHKQLALMTSNLDDVKSNLWVSEKSSKILR